MCSVWSGCYVSHPANGKSWYFVSQYPPPISPPAPTSSLVELERDVGVHAEGEVVVDDVERQVVLALLARLGVVVFRHDRLPPVQLLFLALRDVAQDLRDGLVRVALSEERRPSCVCVYDHGRSTSHVAITAQAKSVRPVASWSVTEGKVMVLHQVFKAS